MSEQTDDRQLKSAVGCGSPAEPYLVISPCEPKPKTQPKFPRRRKTVSRLRPKRSRDALWLRRKRLGQQQPSAEEILVACEMILGTKARSPEPGLPLEMGTPAGSEASHGCPSTTNPELHFKTEGVNFGNRLVENDENLSREEPEAQTSLIERRRSAPTWSVRVVLPRLIGVRLETLGNWLAGAWSRARRQLVSRQTKKRLRVCETVSLGEKRFVAVIEVDRQQFLVGGAASSVATLARLEPSSDFSEVLKRRWSQDPVQA